jgi:hypothetical protein
MTNKTKKEKQSVISQSSQRKPLTLPQVLVLNLKASPFLAAFASFARDAVIFFCCLSSFR